MEIKPRIAIVETPEYLSRCKKIMEDGERFDVVTFLSDNPDAGDLLEGTGGARKLRWSRRGQGKSGGFRIIYFYHDSSVPLFLLTIFAKNERVNLSMAERNQLRQLLSDIVSEYKKGMRDVKGN